jgi:hypothetical protein
VLKPRLEQFRPPPHKSGSKANYFTYLFPVNFRSKIGQNRPKMALFRHFHPRLKIGKLLEQEQTDFASAQNAKNTFFYERTTNR